MQNGYGGIKLDNLSDNYQLPAMLPQQGTEEENDDHSIKAQMIELFAQSTEGLKAEVAYVMKSHEEMAAELTNLETT